jgi:hypothetical protein
MRSVGKFSRSLGKFCGLCPKCYGACPKFCGLCPKFCGACPKFCGLCPKFCGSRPQILWFVSPRTTPNRRFLRSLGEILGYLGKFLSKSGQIPYSLGEILC